MKLYIVTIECPLVPYAVDNRVLGVFDSFDAAKRCEEKTKKFFKDNKIESYFYEENISWKDNSNIEALYDDLLHINEIILNQDYPITGIEGMYLDGGLQIGPSYYE